MSSLRTADGRVLSWVEYGDPTGWPILYCHGAPGCGAELELVFSGAQSARRLGVRLIAPDRPGMGGSSFQRNRRVLDWVADVEALTHRLGIQRFSVLGYSGGTAYALATADRLRAKVWATSILAAVAPLRDEFDAGLDHKGLRMKDLARRRPRMARVALTAAMRLPAVLAPGQLLRAVATGLPPVDEDLLGSAPVKDGFPAMLREAFRHGARGPQEDLALLSDWGFLPSASVGRLHIWQGSQDRTGARPAMAEHLRETVPDSRLHLSEDGHLSIVPSHLEDALRAVTPHGSQGGGAAQEMRCSALGVGQREAPVGLPPLARGHGT